MSNNSTQRCVAATPGEANRALKRLGENIKTARERRRISRELMAERCFCSERHIAHVESGNGNIPIGVYVTALYMLGMSEQISTIADPEGDNIGTILGAHPGEGAPAQPGAASEIETPAQWAVVASASAALLDDASGLDWESVLSQWRLQNGKCALTGIVLKPGAKGLFQPTLSRIDAGGNWCHANVRIVLLVVEEMLSVHNEETVREIVSAMRWNAP